MTKSKQYRDERRKDIKYWRKRAKRIMKEEEKSDAEVLDRVQDITSDMLREIEKEIYKFYAKYAKKEGISIEDAKKKVDATDIRDLEARVKKYVKNKDKSEEANRILRLYNTKQYVSRERMLKKQIEVIMTHGTGLLESEMNEYLEDATQRETKRQSGVIGKTVRLKPNAVRAIVNSDFKGQEWSSRLWKNMGETQKEVERIVSHVMLRGRHPNEFVKDLTRRFGVSNYEARRLLLTETTRVQSEAQKLHYQATMNEDDYVEYMAKIDSKTTVLCKGMDGKLIKVKDLKPGVNMPPMHAFCRSTTGPAITDWRDKFFEENKGKYSLDDFIEDEEPEETPKTEQRKEDKVPGLERQDEGKKIDITDQAIDKVPLVEIPGHSPFYNKTLQEKHKELLEDAKENNNSNEVAYIMNNDTGKYEKVYGNQTSVEFKPGSKAQQLLINSKKQSLTMLHNHPGQSSFSAPDIQTFLSIKSLKIMTIVTNKGQVKYLYKTDDFNSLKSAKAYNDIIKGLKPKQITPNIIEILLKMLYHLGQILFKVR
ncbi:minor capsid protein [Staphylococcus hsinchuensis]|uniref:Minor capsid protein n=1 Tax=Staphylococcus hsinchuensis TaxID=3051183 RepID=A0ABZ3EBE0_9STAP